MTKRKEAAIARTLGIEPPIYPPDEIRADMKRILNHPVALAAKEACRDFKSAHKHCAFRLGKEIPKKDEGIGSATLLEEITKQRQRPLVGRERNLY